MASASNSGGGRRPRRHPKQQRPVWWPSWLPPYNSGGGDNPPEPEAESGPKPPPGIDASGYTPTPGYSLPPAPPPGTNIPGYTPPSSQLAQPSRPDRPNSGPLATTRPQPVLVPPDLLDINPDTVGSLEQHIDAVKVKTVSAMTGTSLNDEEQDGDLEWNRFIQTVDPYVPIEVGPWYTTRLGPAPSSAAAPFSSSYGNMTFPDLINNLDPDGQIGIDTKDKRDSSETDERWYRGSETELDPYLRQALTQTYSGGALGKWNEDWTQLEDLEAFLKDRLAPFFTKDFIDNELQWDRLTGFGMIHMHRSLMEALWNEHWSVDRAQDPWVSSLNEEFADADDLLYAVSTVPLVNEARLIEEFGYSSIEEARDDFLAQVQYAYEKFDIQPPEDLHEWSALELANELYGLLKNVYEPYYEGESSPENFQKAFEFIADPEFNDLYVFHPSVTISRLDGNHQTSPLELVFFVASFFIEPLDWAITIRDMINAAEDGDWGQAVLLGLTGLAPGALGRFVKRGKAHELLKSQEFLEVNDLLDEAVDAAWVNSKVAAASGSNYIQQADGLFAIPGYPGKKNLREQLMRAAEYNPDLAWKAPDLNSNVAQDAHHIVPKGMSQLARAREILAAKSISVDSHLNGITLNKTVHYLTYGAQYARAVNRAIESLQYAPREEIVMFLEDLARRLDKLNAPDIDHSGIYQKDVMDWLETFKQT